MHNAFQNVKFNIQDESSFREKMTCFDNF